MVLMILDIWIALHGGKGTNPGGFHRLRALLTAEIFGQLVARPIMPMVLMIRHYYHISLFGNMIGNRESKRHCGENFVMYE